MKTSSTASTVWQRLNCLFVTFKLGFTGIKSHFCFVLQAWVLTFMFSLCCSYWVMKNILIILIFEVLYIVSEWIEFMSVKDGLERWLNNMNFRFGKSRFDKDGLPHTKMWNSHSHHIMPTILILKMSWHNSYYLVQKVSAGSFKIAARKSAIRSTGTSNKRKWPLYILCLHVDIDISLKLWAVTEPLYAINRFNWIFNRKQPNADLAEIQWGISQSCQTVMFSRSRTDQRV